MRCRSMPRHGPRLTGDTGRRWCDSDRSSRGRNTSHRSGHAPVPSGHGRADDPARGGDRGARNQFHERVLRRPGSHCPRDARGHGRVARKLVGLTLENGDVPPPAHGAGRTGEIGRITSSVWSPALERSIALAYVHREFAGPGTMVTVDGTPAVVTALPFVGGRADAPSTG